LLLQHVGPHGILVLSFFLNELYLSMSVELLEGEHCRLESKVTEVGSLLDVVEKFIKQLVSFGAGFKSSGVDTTVDSDWLLVGVEVLSDPLLSGVVDEGVRKFVIVWWPRNQCN